MKRIVFVDIPMKKKLDKHLYAAECGSSVTYDREVIFPINAVLAGTINKDEDIKVVLLKKLDAEGNSDIHSGEFMKELNSINRDIGARISYEIVDTPFEETREIHESLLRRMIAQIENGAAVYADITYGPKPLPIILFCVLNFAEKFFNCDIKNIVYGKVDFITLPDGNTRTENPVLFDVTPLYYLNSVINAIECKSSEEALKMLDALLAL